MSRSHLPKHVSRHGSIPGNGVTACLEVAGCDMEVRHLRLEPLAYLLLSVGSHRWFSFTSMSMPLHEDRAKASHSEMEPKNGCAWRMEELSTDSVHLVSSSRPSLDSSPSATDLS